MFGRVFQRKELIAMKNILVAYDGGEPAYRALETGDRVVKEVRCIPSPS